MDTHIASSPDLDRHDLQLSARLPNEPDFDDAASAEATPREKLAPAQPAAPRNKNRGILLGGVAAIAVLAIAGGVFVLSPYNHVVPVPARVTAAVHTIERDAGFKSDAPLAPAASLASVAMTPRPESVEVPKYQPRPRDENLSEILAMRPGASPEAVAPHAPARTALAPASAAPSSFVPHEPGAMPAEPAVQRPPVPMTPTTAVAIPPDVTTRSRQSNDITAAIIRATEGHSETAEPASPSPAPAPALVASVKPAEPSVTPVQQAATLPAPAPEADATTRAQHLLAGPMTSDEQVKVLELVTQMATIVHDQKAQIGALRADFAKTKLDDQARLADFARRVDMAEATRAVAAASGLETPAAPLSSTPSGTVAVRPVMAMAPVAVTRADVAVPSTQEAKHYRVQAASPGLALLSEVERGGGEGAQIQVIVGGSIPGYGRVKSIAQIGSSWAVRTENGDVR